MTVSTTTNRVSYAGNGVTTAFSFPYPYLAKADLVALLVNDTTGASTTQALTTDYTLTSPDPAGGTLTMLAAPATGYTLVIYRDPAITQTTDWTDGDNLPAASIENAMDRQTMIALRLRDLVDRSFRLADSDTSGISLEIGGLEADDVIAVNSAGTGIEGLALGSVALAVPADGSVTTAKLDVDVFSGLTTVTALAADHVVIADASDTGNAKKALVSDIVTLAQATMPILNVAGDIIYATADNTPARLPIGTANQQLRTNAGATAPEWFTPSSGVTQGTAIATTSGTAHGFTSLPAGTKRIVLSFAGISTGGSSDFIVQIGDSGGYENTGYSSQACDGGTPSTSTAGFIQSDTPAAARSYHGSVILTLVDAATNTWAAHGCLVADTGAAVAFYSAGSKALSATLDRVQLTTVSGDTFDAGLVNIQYE